MNAAPVKLRSQSPKTRRAPIQDRPSTPQSFLAKFSTPSGRLSHDLNLSFQFNSTLTSRRLLDSVNQLEHLGRGRAAIVHDEIAVHFRHARFSHNRVF